MTSTENAILFVVSHSFELLFCIILVAMWANAIRGVLNWRQRTAQATGVVIEQPGRFVWPNKERRTTFRDIRFVDSNGGAHIINLGDQGKYFFAPQLVAGPFGFVVREMHYAPGTEVIVDYNPAKPDDCSISHHSARALAIFLIVIAALVLYFTAGMVLNLGRDAVRCYSHEHVCTPPPTPAKPASTHSSLRSDELTKSDAGKSAP